MKPPSIVIAYVLPSDAYGNWQDYANRFVASLLLYTEDTPYELVVICNGSKPAPWARQIFDFENVRFFEHDNTGKDLGGFFALSKTLKCEIVVLMGTTSYPTGPGWLKRVVESVERNGYGLFGAMHNNGDPRFGVWPHIRTTGFWINPLLFNQYPHRQVTNSTRYAVEHGPECITSWVRKKGLGTFVVTWTDTYPAALWATVPNGFHAGGQTGLLIKDHLAEPPYFI